MLKLYISPVAPNPTKVRLYLAEKRALGCEIEVEEVPINLGKLDHKKPEHLARNPFGVLPVLELKSGAFLIESLSIIDFLEELHPDPSIWGGDVESRALARQVERIAELGGLIPMANVVHATDSPVGREANPIVAKHYRDRLTPNLDYLEDLLSDGRPFLTGATVSVADCTLAAGFQFGRFRNLDFTEGYPEIQRWDSAYRKRDPATGIIVL